MYRVKPAINILIMIYLAFTFALAVYSESHTKDSYSVSGNGIILIQDKIESEDSQNRQWRNEGARPSRNRRQYQANRSDDVEPEAGADENPSLWTAANGFITVCLILIMFVGLIFGIALRKRRI